MSSNRIQKLLFSEYSEFEDIVLVESTFAETTRQGKGIRQVQMGLTPSRLVLASYCVDWEAPRRTNRRDPDIDCFELVSAFPVECVHLSVFRHRRRQTLKAHFCNGKVHYFEIGGWNDRWMLWSVWCERLKFLSPYDAVTSLSETSVGSSSSGSCLYIVRSALTLSQTGKTTLWCTYGADAAQASRSGSWADPHVYLGPSFMEKGINFTSKPGVERAISSVGGNIQNMTSHLSKSMPGARLGPPLSLSLSHEQLARQAVELWESGKPLRAKVRRRYALHPRPGLLAGLGLWHVSGPHAFSLQRKQSVSLVSLVSADDQLIVPARHQQLIRTVSLEQLAVPAMCPDKLFEMLDDKPPKQKQLDFWTHNPSLKLEWRRKEYRAQRRTLRDLRRRSTVRVHSTKSGRKINRGKIETEEDSYVCRVEDGAGGGDSCAVRPTTGENTKQQASDGGPVVRLSSTAIAHQLTMLDKQLFRQLSILELARVWRDKNSWRAPRLRALLYLSYRVSYLVASQIIAGATVKERAVQIVKYVGVAYRCHKLHNLHSASSVLHGLQCPAVYRLHHSWGYVRKHHATKYRRFEDLSKRYHDPRLPLYQKTVDDLTKSPPYLPSMELVIGLLLGQITHLPGIASAQFSTDSCTPPPSERAGVVPQGLKRFLSAFSVYNSSSSAPQSKPENDIASCQSMTHLHAVSEETLKASLDQFFAPLTDRERVGRLQDLQYLVGTSQAAAGRYAIPLNNPARHFLLQTPYRPPRPLFGVSRELEPCG